ncbi:MAG: putative DNA binding domain-containing protein [Roseburia sp.]|nr:putative DNA binding domain-containing protein [Roseburia sp.]
MELEVNIENLLRKEKIESDRVEFKTGWNPDDIYHSVCAFANDYNNEGGGYILVGVEEKDGVAIRPVKGIPENMLDKIQQEMIGYNNLLSPAYFPKVVLTQVDDQWILVIVVRTGQQRPYKVPEYVTNKKDKKYHYYIRYLTNSVKANLEQERELINMSDQTPFDCRANHKATFEDISPVLLEDHLRKTGSRLAKQVRERGAEAILEDMQLLEGPPELRYIQNVALMMFCEHPERFFKYTFVQMTSFPEGSIKNPGLSVDYPNIMGSVPQMIQATMERFKTLVIQEKVIKVHGRMEALRIMNYPYQAVEEAVVNAFYHRDYMSCEPITIEIEPDCINIMNFPGIDRSISQKTITEGKRFVSRYYRNRRLGEFLKELDLSEGHSSGIPTIQEELKSNGSPRAEFFTDEDRRAMRIRIPIHSAFLEDINEENNWGDIFNKKDRGIIEIIEEKATKRLSKKTKEQYITILGYMGDEKWHKTSEIAEILGLKETRTKELLKELVMLEQLEDNGKTKGKMYRVK